MIRIITFAAMLFLFSCASNKKASSKKDLPSCLETKIKSMTENPSEGAPQAVTRYHYNGKTVYYMKAPCCDKFNIVFDSACNILGYPDGGYTGRGDGKMTDFFKGATDEKVVWQKKE
jgi:hypothetical protein